MRYPEYEEWARATLNRRPSWTDWSGLTTIEASRRAISLCNVARENEGWIEMAKTVDAARHLEKFAEFLADRYSNRR